MKEKENDTDEIMPMGEDLDRKLIESVDTKLLLKELLRRGVKMTNVQIPVTTYEEVNLEDI